MSLREKYHARSPRSSTTITHKYKNERVKRHELTWKIPRQKPTKFYYHKPINQSNQSNQINSNTTLKRHTTNIKTNEKNAMSLRGIYNARSPRSSTTTNTLQRCINTIQNNKTQRAYGSS